METAMRALTSILLIPALLLSLSACFGDPPDDMAEAATGEPPPPMLCQQVREALDALSSKGALDYDKDGTAVVEESVWAMMGAESRDKVGQALAFHAACVAKKGMKDQPITVRNQAGNVVSRRSIDTRVNAMSMIAD